MGALEDLVAQLRGSQDDYMSQYLAASQAALEPKRNTPGNVLEQALVGGIPMLAGLFRGREGLAAGAQGAAVGLNVLGTQQKEEAENLQKQKLLEAQSSLDSFKSAREKLQELQITQAVEPFKQGIRTDANIELENQRQENRREIEGMRDARYAARKEGGGEDEPVFKSELSKKAFELLDAGKKDEVTDEMRSDIRNESMQVQNLWQRINEAKEVGDRFATNKEISDASRNTPGFTLREGYKPYASEVQKFRALNTTNKQIDNLLVQLKTSLSKNGQEITGKDAVLQIQLLGELAREQKKRFEGGAAYTLLESIMANQVLPKLYNDPNISMFQAFKGTALERNPIEYINNLRGILAQQTVINARGLGYEPIVVAKPSQ